MPLNHDYIEYDSILHTTYKIVVWVLALNI